MLPGVTVSFVCGVVSLAPISWRNFASASSHSRSSSQTAIGTTILGSSWATTSAARVALSCPPIGTQATSTGPISPIFSSVSRWAMSPRCANRTPSSSTEKDTFRPRSAPRLSSRNVRTPMRRTCFTSYSPGPSSTNAPSRLVGRKIPPSRVATPFARGSGSSSGWLNVTMSPVMPRPVGPTTDWYASATTTASLPLKRTHVRPNHCNSMTRFCHAALTWEFVRSDCRRRARRSDARASNLPEKEDRERLPNRRPRSEGGRKDLPFGGFCSAVPCSQD